MENNSTSSSMVGGAVVGLDLSDVSSTFVVIDAETGEIVEEGSVATNRADLKKVFGCRPACHVAIEAGAHSPWISRLLTELGHEVIVANPRRVALINRNNRKSDRMDAIVLARLARFDRELLFPIEHRGEEAQLDLALLRTRDFLVTNRTRSINYVRNLVKSFGEQIPKCSSEAFPVRAAECLPQELSELLMPLLEEVSTLTARIQEMERKVEELIETKYREALLVKQVKGVGPITSLAFVLTLEEVSRFQTSRDVPAYLGLTPGRRQSGASDPEMHITKAGDAFLRKLLIQASHYILGPFGEPSDLRTWGLRLAGQTESSSRSRKRGKKQQSNDAAKRAVTAVARKLAVLLHHLWRTGETYEPLRQERRQSVTPGRVAETSGAA
jgi:transposase